MSYQVLARKWRPQNLQQLIGQEHISTTLLNALKNNRLPHALLFTGVRGTGKTSSARILAKILRCPQVKNFEACLQCPECEDIALGRAVDVIEIDGASNNGVDSVRELRENVNFRPSSGKYKIIIIDEVHMLSASAFNALLKTLEEPPEHVIFILATTEVQKIPQTILSRCQRFDFRRISTQRIADHLSRICEVEKIKTTPEALWMIARQGDGSMRDSQSLLDQATSFSGGELTAEAVTQILGLTDRKILQSFLSQILEQNSAAAIETLQKSHQSGQSPQLILEGVLELLRHLLVLKTSRQAVVDLPDSEIEWLKSLLPKVQEEDLHRLFDMTLKGLNDLVRATEPDLVLDMVLLRLTQAPKVRQLVELVSQAPVAISTATPGLKKAPPQAELVASTAVSPPATTSSARTPSNETWLQFVRQLKQKDVLLAAKVEPLVFVQFRSPELILAVPLKFAFLKDQLQEGTTKERFDKALAQFWQQNLLLVLQVEKDPKGVSVQRVDEKQKIAEQDEIKSQVMNHPRVKAMAQALKGEVKSIQPLQKER